MKSLELEATKVPTEIDIAWAAGIYEGEGSCIKSGSKGNSFTIAISQKDPELLYMMRDLFGGGIKLYNVGKENRFPIYYWQVCGNRARLFIASVYPFLTSRRKAQIDDTKARVFLNCASDLLVLPSSDGVCKRFELISKRLEEFVESKRTESHNKRRDYLRAYCQGSDYKESQRIKAASAGKIKRRSYKLGHLTSCL